MIRQTTANTKKTNYVVAPRETQLARLKRNGPKMAITKMVPEVDRDNKKKKKEREDCFTGRCVHVFFALKAMG